MAVDAHRFLQNKYRPSDLKIRSTYLYINIYIYIDRALNCILNRFSYLSQKLPLIFTPVEISISTETSLSLLNDVLGSLNTIQMSWHAFLTVLTLSGPYLTF